MRSVPHRADLFAVINFKLIAILIGVHVSGSGFSECQMNGFNRFVSCVSGPQADEGGEAAL